MPRTAPQRARRRRSSPASRPNAYVKPVNEDGETIYAVFTADGQLVGVAPTRGLAHLGARQHALDPVDAH